MLGTGERIAALEDRVTALAAEVGASASFTINVLVATLDELVDRRAIEADTRTEILGRVRKEIDLYRRTADNIYYGASRAVPHYRTKAEDAAINQRNARYRQEVERNRKELLRPRGKSNQSDQ